MQVMTLEQIEAVAKAINCVILDETFNHKGQIIPQFRLEDTKPHLRDNISFVCSDLLQMSCYIGGLRKGLRWASLVAKVAIEAHAKDIQDPGRK